MSQDPFAPPKEGPSTLLKVLCIIVFITAGLALVSNVSEALSPPTAEQTEEAWEKSVSMWGGGMDEADEQTQEVFERSRQAMVDMGAHATPIGWTKALGCALALLGAWSMWRLRRVGFHLYIVGGVLWSCAPIFVVGANLVTWSFVLAYGFVCLVFTILFATCLKEMR